MGLSIIVPIYGVEKYLRQCLDSICAQTFKDFECILVDDGSRDGCPAICDEYALKDSRFKVIHKLNAGYGAAVNSGLDVATGEYVGIVEPDDWIEPDMYEVLMRSAEESGRAVDVVKAEFISFYDSGKEAWKITRFDRLAKTDCMFKISEIPWLLREHPSIWTCVYRHDFLLRNGIRMEESEGATWQDNLFQVQTLFLAQSISCVPKVVYHYRLFEDKPLKDAVLPLRRTLQIRQWLKVAGHFEFAPCAALFIREMHYLRMSIASARFSQLREIASAASELLTIYRNDFKHDYDYKSLGLSILLISPVLFVYYTKIRQVLGRLLRRLYRREES